MKKRFVAVGLSVLLSMSMAFNGFAAIFDFESSVKDEYGNEYVSQNNEEYISLIKEAYDKYGVSYYIDEINQPQVYTYNELKEKAESEARENFREYSRKEMETIPRMKQSVTHPDMNTCIYDDAFKDWSGVKDKEGTALKTTRIVTTTRNNREGSYSMNFKVYNTDNELVDNDRYFISISVVGYFKENDTIIPMNFYLAGNDASITIPGKTVSVPRVRLTEKATGKTILNYAASANDLNQYNDSVYKLPYASKEAYQKLFEETANNYNKAVEEVKAQYPQFENIADF